MHLSFCVYSFSDYETNEKLSLWYPCKFGVHATVWEQWRFDVESHGQVYERVQFYKYN